MEVGDEADEEMEGVEEETYLLLSSSPPAPRGRRRRRRLPREESDALAWVASPVCRGLDRSILGWIGPKVAKCIFWAGRRIRPRVGSIPLDAGFQPDSTPIHAYPNEV
jgi:hypothetical protein